MRTEQSNTILHIGNVANNAYLNSKILNAEGVRSFVLCYDYYHIMGYPEWEDGDLKKTPNAHIHPDWDEAEFKKEFKRPRWFVQGPLGICLRYLKAEITYDFRQADAFWRLLTLYRVYMAKRVKYGKIKSAVILLTKIEFSDVRIADIVLMFSLQRLFRRTKSWLFERFVWMLVRLVGIVQFPIFAKEYFSSNLQITWQEFFEPKSIAISKYIRMRFRQESESSVQSNEQIAERLAADFGELYPNRPKLEVDEAKKYVCVPDLLKEVFDLFDFVIGYATGTFLPLFAGKKYIAYEHGTIRDLPWKETTEGKLLAIAFKQAAGLFMTNADSVDSALRLQPENRIISGVHGFDLNKIHAAFACQSENLPNLLRMKHGVSEDAFWIFSPTRHDWSVKGNDVFIRGLAHAINKSNVKFRITLVRWGAEVDRSTELLDSMGLASITEWIDPLSKSELNELLGSSDLVVDQFVIPCLGAIGLETLASGKTPLLTAIDQESMVRYYKEAVPCIGATTVQEVEQGITQYLRSSYSERQELIAQGRLWMESTHSHLAIKRYFNFANQLAAFFETPDRNS